MGGYEILILFIGIIGGNFGAVIVQPLNIGLLGNSLAGSAGAATFMWLPGFFNLEINLNMLFQLLVAGASGLLFMLVAGALIALQYRD